MLRLCAQVGLVIKMLVALGSFKGNKMVWIEVKFLVNERESTD